MTSRTFVPTFFVKGYFHDILIQVGYEKRYQSILFFPKVSSEDVIGDDEYDVVRSNAQVWHFLRE